MHVMTVNGPIAPEEIGITLMHEHVLLDMDWPGLWPDVSHRPELVWQKVAIENLGELRRNYMAVRDNALFDNIPEMAEELGHFRALGGGTVAEMTTLGLKPNPAGLREVSVRTGVHIVAGTGFYLQETLSPAQAALDLDAMRALMVRDLAEGFPGTDIRAGVIGEIALNNPIKPVEERALRAAARAQQDTGAVLCVHGFSIEVIRILRQEGADLNRVVACHQDGVGLEHGKLLADLGIYVEFDCWGNETYADNGAYDSDTAWYLGSDSERFVGLLRLLEAGYAERLLLSQDCCTKIQLRRYGGYGYAHILENVVPTLLRRGVTQDEIDIMTRHNPARLLPIQA
jgi:phosphotriesterase-related protein